jgi:anaerobic selenocysteine-containing dehydrogenase
MGNTQLHYRTCNLCEAMCGLEIEHNQQEILSIKGDENDVFSKGHICPKALALKDLHEDKDRLKTPLKRTDKGWQEISWNEAFDEVIENIKVIQKKHGTHAVGVYRGNPNVHNLGLMLYGSSFIKSLQTQQRYSATSVDQLPHHIASLFMFGHQMMIPIPDIDHTDFMLIIGGNPAVSNGSMMTAPNFSGRLKAIQKRGGKFMVIDPRFTETAKIADAHFFINPGKDAYLLLALIHVIFDQKIDNLGAVASYTNGLEKIKTIALDFAPEKVADHIGISAKKIKIIASEFANAKSAICYGRMGVSVQEFGGVCQWLMNVLNTITGNLDTKGGTLFTLPAIDLVGMATKTGRTGSFNKRRSRVHKLPDFAGEYPVSTLADEILTEGEGQIKAMITIAGNPVLSTPNGKHVEKALESLDFMVAIDIYLNETSKYANIILPSTTGLETAHYDLIFHQLAVRNTAKYNEALYKRKEDQRHDWEVLNALTERMTGQKNPATPEMMLDYLFGTSPYKVQEITVKKLKENPHGIDLGALKPCLPERLFTKDKKVELAPELFLKDLKRLQKDFSAIKTTKNSELPFSLISRRHLRNNNSWMHNAALLMTGRERCTLLMHPIDAEQLKIENHQQVTVTSNVDSIQLPIEISNEMMQGVVSIPHGFGHHRTGTNIKLAQENAGVSINDLTDNKSIDLLTGNANLSGTKVKIEAL